MIAQGSLSSCNLNKSALGMQKACEQQKVDLTRKRDAQGMGTTSLLHALH